VHRSRSHDAVIRVYDEAGNVIETHEHKGDFKRVVKRAVPNRLHSSHFLPYFTLLLSFISIGDFS